MVNFRKNVYDYIRSIYNQKKKENKKKVKYYINKMIENI